MLASVMLERAQACLERKTAYKLGKGNFSTKKPQLELGKQCDCSGFVAYCMMFNRKTDHPLYVKVNGGWFDTTAIHRDLQVSQGFFDALDAAKPGAIVVYPDAGGHQGHIGIVVEANGPGVKGIDRIIHCSSGNFRSNGDAIQITAPSAFLARKDSLIGWYGGLTE
jgi:cell wall-associated NlpC family hydrolase